MILLLQLMITTNQYNYSKNTNQYFVMHLNLCKNKKMPIIFDGHKPFKEVSKAFKN